MTEATGNRRTSMRATDKPFNIDKKLVYEAYQAVKSNGGAAGVDGQTIEQFEADLKSNLYKIWNRMSSGSYFPPPVRAVSIPKKSGGQRILGVPTVADRVAQMGVTRERCWKYDWVLEFDIKGLFDNINHELLLRAIRKHVTCKWALLYIERWLKAPMMQEDGTTIERDRGTPQGGVVTPRTQKVISSSNGQLRDGEPGTPCLIFVSRSNTLMTHGALNQSREGSTLECRSCLTPASCCASRSSTALVAPVRFVRASSISLPGESLAARSSRRSSRCHCTDHVEASAAHGGSATEVREKQWTDHWSNRDRRVECVSTHSKKAWLSRVQKTAHFKSMFPIRLIACSSRSSLRPTIFWCPVASAPSACA